MAAVKPVHVCVESVGVVFRKLHQASLALAPLLLQRCSEVVGCAAQQDGDHVEFRCRSSDLDEDSWGLEANPQVSHARA